MSAPPMRPPQIRVGVLPPRIRIPDRVEPVRPWEQPPRCAHCRRYRADLTSSCPGCGSTLVLVSEEHTGVRVEYVTQSTGPR